MKTLISLMILLGGTQAFATGYYPGILCSDLTDAHQATLKGLAQKYADEYLAALPESLKSVETNVEDFDCHDYDSEMDNVEYSLTWSQTVLIEAVEVVQKCEKIFAVSYMHEINSDYEEATCEDVEPIN